jgi:hypothetical protein
LRIRNEQAATTRFFSFTDKTGAHQRTSLFRVAQKNFDGDSRVANATASLLATMHDHHTNNELEMILSS